MPDPLALFLELPGDIIGYGPDMSRRRTARNNKIVANARHLPHVNRNYIERFLIRRSLGYSQGFCLSFYILPLIVLTAAVLAHRTKAQLITDHADELRCR